MSSLIEVDATEVNKALREVIDKTKDQTKPMAETSILMLKDVQKHFQDEEGSEGPWKKLADSTLKMRRHPTGKPSGIMLKAKKQRKIRTRILQDTGTLKKSIGTTYDSEFASVYTSIEYGKYHQFGSADNKRPPKRDFLWLSDDIIERIIARFAAHNLGEAA